MRARSRRAGPRASRHRDGGRQKPALEYGTEVFRLDAGCPARLRAVPRGGARRQRGGEGHPGRLPAAGEPAAGGDPVRYPLGRHLVERPLSRRAGGGLDPSPHRRQGPLLHHAAGGQRDLRGAASARTRPGWSTPGGWRCCAPAPTSTGRRRAGAPSTTCWTSPIRAGSRRRCRNWCGAWQPAGECDCKAMEEWGNNVPR